MEQSGLTQNIQLYRSEPQYQDIFLQFIFSREKYEEVGKKIGDGGFGSVRLLRELETKEVFAGKFVKTNTKQKRQSKLSASVYVFYQTICQSVQ